MYSVHRPFEIIKLIRDGVITNVKDFYSIPDSSFFGYVDGILRGLVYQELIQIRDGEIKVTPKLNDFFKSLNISLARLANYHDEAIVCSPTFGVPFRSAINADVFVVMPFNEDLRSLYEDHIKKVAAQLGLSVARGDDFFTADSIMSDIWSAINECRILVADCSGKNPNVFYEMGIAHTLGKPVIPIANSIQDIPFDIQHRRAIIYEFTPRGMADFEGKLKATIEWGLTPETLKELMDYYAKFMVQEPEP